MTAVRARRGLIAAVALWILVVANFNTFVIRGGDAGRPYSFVQRLFGDNDHPSGYQFGLAFFEAPFYALGKLLIAVGVPTVGGNPVEAGFVALASPVFVLAIGALMLPLLRRLRLPSPTFVLVAALFGSPLYYWALFDPGHTHAVDTLLLTATIVLLHRYLTRAGPPSWRLAAAMGAVIGVATAVRSFNGFELVALVVGLLWCRRFRDAGIAVIAAAAVAGLLVIVPIALGAGLLDGLTKGDKRVGFYPLNPLRMLFTDRRGLFVWTPVTLLGVIGYVRMLRLRAAERPFLAIAGGMGLAIVLSYVLVPYWDGGFSFSQRYYTPLFPLVAIGLASLVEWRPRPIVVLATLATIWSVSLGFYVGLGFGFSEYHGGASDWPRRILNGTYTPGIIAFNICEGSRFRLVLPQPYRHCRRS